MCRTVVHLKVGLDDLISEEIGYMTFLAPVAKCLEDTVRRVRWVIPGGDEELFDCVSQPVVVCPSISKDSQQTLHTWVALFYSGEVRRLVN